MGWLPPDEWEKFAELFEKKEGTNWYDAKELMFQIIGSLDVDIYDKCRENEKRLGLTDLMQVRRLRVANCLRIE